ncbi:Smc5-Smc6 complex subunit NSE3 NDAI_0C03950 [Naumovozyma dairenensis CBS 421]|uniref:MAGE domain-containing protein n=1 Tax=Naumovozyma dairenensis (strain ATCC 10597 / BCRC 20456 / CBS 421 / NBRC 0211 / NRRL Y-12639) TaxID=1071378 RepID=G0W8E4_NAUDC|nr:hypothetical protein NDAI_0C03950 [Naumovozyma dairenensis CBS 421]CCD24055.1 hypothetical protein NDAI_0C03950 [Naumovozyma dairenensis CBS 421]
MSDSEEYIEQSATPTYGQNKTNTVAIMAVRYLLSSAESQNTIITQSKLKTVLRDIYSQQKISNIPFNKVFAEINNILGDVYGYELKGLPSKIVNNNVTNSNNNSNKNPGNRTKEVEEALGYRATCYILVNKMPYLKNFDEFKLLQSIRTYEDLVVDGQYVGDDVGLENLNTLENKLSVDQDLVFKGLLSVILCIVLFSKNNILHQELLSALEKFGVPTDGTKIPILKWSIDDLMKNLEKKEYLVKLEEKSDIEGSLILYRIGRRTQAEFGLDSLLMLVQEIMNLDGPEAEGLKEDIQKSIGDAYGPAVHV